MYWVCRYVFCLQHVLDSWAGAYITPSSITGRCTIRSVSGIPNDCPVNRALSRLPIHNPGGLWPGKKGLLLSKQKHKLIIAQKFSRQFSVYQESHYFFYPHPKTQLPWAMMSRSWLPKLNHQLKDPTLLSHKIHLISIPLRQPFSLFPNQLFFSTHRVV